MSVKLRLVEMHKGDAYSINPNVLRVGDVIEFEEMPKFSTWDWEGHPVGAYAASIEGFDYNNEDAVGTNLRTGTRKDWCFHAVKFERV